jgi:two-component system chemotaxis response regulator CheY
MAISRPTEAISAYKEYAPDLVLIDRNMPEMDGIKCIENILKIDSAAKIIIISGFESEGPNGIDDNIRQAIKGYLTKPCGATALSSMVFKALAN